MKSPVAANYRLGWSGIGTITGENTPLKKRPDAGGQREPAAEHPRMTFEREKEKSCGNIDRGETAQNSNIRRELELEESCAVLARKCDPAGGGRETLNRLQKGTKAEFGGLKYLTGGRKNFSARQGLMLKGRPRRSSVFQG